MGIIRQLTVSNTGPLIHLNEVNLQNALNIFSNIIIPQEVKNELKNTPLPTNLKIKKLTGTGKDTTKVLIHQGDIDLGEAAAIALAIEEKAEYFITDDLDARRVAKEYNLKVHGTVGIILRAFKEKIINKKQAIEKILELKINSSLFITQDLIKEIITEINNFKF